MKILVINGPNLNLLGIREPDLYGARDYNALVELIESTCHQAGIDVNIYQSNHEGGIIDAIQGAMGVYDGIIINAAAYAHTSIAILDALKAANLPAVEVHISDTSRREPFRQNSFVTLGCVKTFTGMGLDGYRHAVLYLKELLGRGDAPCAKTLDSGFIL